MANYSCSNCGASIKLNQKKCKNCGEELTWDTTTNTEKGFFNKLANLLKRGFFIGCYLTVIVLYILSFYSINILAPFYSILVILPIRFLADENNGQNNIKSVFLRIKHFWTEYKTRTIVSLILFLVLFSSSFVSILKNIKIHNIPVPVIEILSQSGNIGNSTGYTLVYKTKDTTEVLINGKSYGTENSINYSLEGVGNYVLNISILAKNEYKSSEKELIITRNKTTEEVKMENEKQKQEEMKRQQEESDNRIIYAGQLRDRYLDAGLDIKVSVSGKGNKTLILTYVLMGDVFVHQLQKAQEIERQGMGFTHIDFKDGYGYYHAWLNFNQ